MSLTFTRAVRVPAVGGVLTDADVTPTITVVRTDTSAVVVPSDYPTHTTADMTHDSTGRYSYTLTGEVAGVTYRATTVITVGGQTVTSDSDLTAGATGSATGVYATQQDVQDLIGEANLKDIGDLDADGNLDAGIVQRALDFADAYINLELSRNALTTPADLTDATRAAILRDIAAHLAVWHLWHHRGIKEAPSRGPADGIGGVFEGYKGYADAQLAKLVEVLGNEDDTDAATPAGGFSFVPMKRTTCCGDENSRCWN